MARRSASFDTSAFANYPITMCLATLANGQKDRLKQTMLRSIATISLDFEDAERAAAELVEKARLAALPVMTETAA